MSVRAERAARVVRTAIPWAARVVREAIPWAARAVREAIPWAARAVREAARGRRAGVVARAGGGSWGSRSCSAEARSSSWG
ncbi:hypothetical protein RB625_05290 [Streptomyces californicus]|uniref:hypothetical protein n=1 Tax=Streptomyces californicus TaxID=67351 RepID=UPI00296EB1F0|nr:hypothetical protein [Streptomyces californicus]MDW4897804.1 hypothetical protein [Streptomyces californicus]